MQGRLPLKIAAIYAVVGVLWIFFSDQLAHMLSHTPQTLKQISMAKGWLYVVLTALLLFKLVSRGLKEILRSQEVLRLSEEQFRVMFDLASVGMAQAEPPAVMSFSGYLPHRLAMEKIISPDNLFLVHRQHAPLSLRHKMSH